MACYYPLQGWKARGGGWTANRRDAFIDLPMNVACGRCMGCRLERSRQWAVRCMHEKQLHELNGYLTLTYADEHLPETGTVVVDHFQKFMKRYRRWLGQRISFFHCGEYGAKLERPHYHAIIFGHDFADKRRWKRTEGGHWLYVSDQLDKLWGHGYCTIGEVTFDSAAYVARYCTKKVNGPMAKDHYTRILPTGEIVQLHPEYVTMSRRPAIAKRWLERFGSDVYPHDYVVVNGKEAKPPRYYDKQHAELDAVAHRRVELARIVKGNTIEQKRERTPERLEVRRKVKEAQVSAHLPRRLEK